MNSDVTGAEGSRGTARKVRPLPLRPPRRRKGIAKWVVLGLVLAFVVGGAWMARPAWRAVKRYRAAGFANQSEELMRQEKWGPAFQKMRAALQLSPTNPRILRLAARLYASAGSEVAFPYFESLVASPDVTSQDREDFATLALRLGNPQLAAGQVQNLLTSPNASARTFLLAAQIQSARRSYTNAVRFAREAVQAEPANPTNLLALASFLLATRIPADVDEARAVLWPIARAEGPLQLPALSAIFSAPGSPRGEREEVASLLESKPQRSAGEELLMQEVRVSLDPSQRMRIADDLIERYGRGTPEQMGAVAAWLNRQQLYSRTLELVLPDVARSNSRLFQLRYEALMGREDYRAAYDFVSSNVSTKDPMEIEFLRCRTAMKLKDTVAADSHFKNLLELAAREPRLLRSVADFALRNGRRDIANDAAQRLSRSPRDAGAAYATLLRIADSQGETWVARDYCRKLAALNPQKVDEAIRFQIAYYDLLLNENIDAALATAEAMQKAAPNDYSRRAVLGLAYLRKGDPKRAVEVIDNQVVTWSKLPPGVRAITLAILGANQREDAAAKLLARIPLQSLKPEERDLIRPYVTEGAVGSTEDEGITPLQLPDKL